MNPYLIFLTIELARNLGVIPKDLEYDLTWEKGEKLFEIFETSSFNRNSVSEYDGIEEFLLDYQKRHK